MIQEKCTLDKNELFEIEPNELDLVSLEMSRVARLIVDRLNLFFIRSDEFRFLEELWDSMYNFVYKLLMVQFAERLKEK